RCRRAAPVGDRGARFGPPRRPRTGHLRRRQRHALIHETAPTLAFARCPPWGLTVASGGRAPLRMPEALRERVEAALARFWFRPAKGIADTLAGLALRPVAM